MNRASDFFPVWSGQRVYFLSGRAGSIGIFSYDPATKRVAEALHNDGADIRSLGGDAPPSSTISWARSICTIPPPANRIRLFHPDRRRLPEVRRHIRNVAGEIDVHARGT